MKISRLIFLFLVLFFTNTSSYSQPNWTAIKSHATFLVNDTNYLEPTIQPINIPGWEDGLYITRDGKHLFSTYLPLDAFSWITALAKNPVCFNFHPYYRPPLLGIDTITNPWGCNNFMNSDIVIAERADTSQVFNQWHQSNLHSSMYFDGGACGVLKNSDTFDVFVFTKDEGDLLHSEIMFMKNVPVNPSYSSAIAIVSSTGMEDNPHIERLADNTLVLIFDRDRYMYYSLSTDDGTHWETPIKITHVLNDYAPYDVQPHLWNDGSSWWVYFCANNESGIRCIYRSKQMIENKWDSWDIRELVIAPNSISNGSGTIFGIGEPTLTTWGDLSFVVVYGNNSLADTTDVFDCDPWIMKRKTSGVKTGATYLENKTLIEIYPTPSNKILYINGVTEETKITLYDINGKFLIDRQITNNQIDISLLVKGVYFIKFSDKSGVIMRKFIKE